MSNIRVLVDWERSSVFAGEDLKCTITFTNVATVSRGPLSPSPTLPIRGPGSGRDRWRKVIPDQRKSDLSQRLPLIKDEPIQLPLQSHRATSSLNHIPGSGTRPFTYHKTSEKSASREPKHQRSVSIVSNRGIAIGEDGDTKDKHNPTSKAPQYPERRHGRAASLQSYIPKLEPTIASRPGTTIRTSNVTIPPSGRITYHAKPNLYEASTSTGESCPSSSAASISQACQTTDTDIQGIAPSNDIVARSRPGYSSPELPKEASIVDRPLFRPSFIKGGLSNTSEAIPYGNITEGVSVADRTRLLANILSPVSRNGTPRSSIDLYTASNNSAETLASDFIAPTAGKQLTGLPHGHQPTGLAPIVSHIRPSETLMIGYVQITGAFTLDGSLISLSPFEDIKRKGVIGGQGSGGVVGVELTKKQTGLLGTLSWGNIGESLGGLLGTSEPSSIREMKDIASTRSIPILSTPQSILFVNMRLGPGESRSYSYSYVLPRGIPPSHKGRAMKITYNLVIGTQRAQSKAQQHLVRHVEVPFRVLPGVNGQGEILGHDLMCPHIILQNYARTASLDDRPKVDADMPEMDDSLDDKVPDDFLWYLKHLLDRPRQDSSLGLLSPTDSLPGVQSSIMGNSVSSKEIIDYAILRGNAPASSNLSPNRFQIQRGLERVAVILLARAAYRLGETICAIVDFQDANVPCLSVHVTLESSEVIDPALALRSSSSVKRATQRVHAVGSEYTICAQRATFAATVPISATPDFITSGVNLEWGLRFEFMTLKANRDEKQGLMEEVGEDDRERSLAAVETLLCESFDVVVPIRVYGASGGSDEHVLVGGFPI